MQWTWHAVNVGDVNGGGKKDDQTDDDVPSSFHGYLSLEIKRAPGGGATSPLTGSKPSPYAGMESLALNRLQDKRSHHEAHPPFG